MLPPSSELNYEVSGIGLFIYENYNDGDDGTEGKGVQKGIRSEPMRINKVKWSLRGKTVYRHRWET
jgi:hypothetical protein